ncbi:FAD-binding domain-containing protein [Melanomma pulvis-pyrius CBS 109.77]|uniref:FAD-binding domain-containing protein n=1 Tax=Melanomma pulvis-pyrius CBS 109.77 TaxID=1314802 RepID=A0A6A6WP02_9PLEO|nr:FAD-binding domain-containing protein [Melanomma pulvis-pyrius CBS 109.77]
MAALTLFLLVSAALSQPSSASGTGTCKCVPTDSCWPPVSAWESLNTTISGQLIDVQPIAISCYAGPLFNNETCATVNSEWKKCAWQANHPAGQCQDTGDLTCPPVTPLDINGQNCTLGNNPVYAVNATSPEHVAAGIKFAAEHNIRLTVKTTGHDFLRRNQGFGSLEIWMRYHRTGIDFQETYKSCSGCVDPRWTGGSAIRIGGGYQWSDVFAVAKANNVIIVGGGAPSIGANGGWSQGGGYGAAAQQHGIGADQLLEAEVALADGSVITANACQNIDIYTAIRGGGPSTYGVVLSAIFKTHPMCTAVQQRFSIPYTASTRSKFLDAVAVVYSSAPDLLDAGFTLSGFWSQANASLVGSAPSGYSINTYAMNKTVAEGQADFAPVLEKLSTLGFNKGSFY